MKVRTRAQQFAAAYREAQRNYYGADELLATVRSFAVCRHCNVNPARYWVAVAAYECGHAASHCGLCDMTENEGRGHRACDIEGGTDAKASESEDHQPGPGPHHLDAYVRGGSAFAA